MRTTGFSNTMLGGMLLALSTACLSQDLPQLREGDILFQTLRSGQSQAILLATHSRFSHVGMIRRNGSSAEVLEAVQPVKLTPVDEWIKRGEGHHVVVKRLKNADSLRVGAVVQRLRTIEDGYLGKQYDIYFEWSNDRIYCSELIWKVFDEALHVQLCTLQKGSDFDFSSPIVQQKVKERFPNGFPMEEIVVSPDAILHSDLLETVYDSRVPTR